MVHIRVVRDRKILNTLGGRAFLCTDRYVAYQPLYLPLQSQVRILTLYVTFISFDNLWLNQFAPICVSVELV